MRSICLFALMAVAMATPAEEAPVAPGMPAASTRPVTLDDLDKALASFKSAIWSMSESAGSVPPDHTGATFDGDLAKLVLGDATLAKIESLRADLRKSYPQGSAAIPLAARTPLQEVLTGEACRLSMVSQYWSARRFSAYHEDMVQKVIAKLPAVDQQVLVRGLRSLDPRVNALRVVMESQLTACSAGKPLFTGDLLTPILLEYNALRRQAADSLYDAVGVTVMPAMAQRATACPAPVAPAGADIPRVRVISRESLEKFFPAEAVEFQVEGRVEVVVMYDETGCVKSTLISRSSGAELLDKAAMAYAFTMVLQPPVIDGKPVGGAVKAPIAFTLKDVMDAPPRTQSQP